MRAQKGNASDKDLDAAHGQKKLVNISHQIWQPVWFLPPRNHPFSRDLCGHWEAPIAADLNVCSIPKSPT